MSDLLKAALASGVAGWAIENVYAGPRYSRVLGGQQAGVPFLPVYAAGGAAVATVAPQIQHLSTPERFVVYAAGLSALEYGVCAVDRASGHESWSYQGACVDVPHAIAWGFLAIMFEEALVSREQQPRKNPRAHRRQKRRRR